MPRYLDIESWNRKDHFHFFRDFEKPFFNLCANVDITALRAFTKSRDISFFLTSLFLATKAANSVETFRYRLRDDKVLVYESIHCGSTVLRDDDSFGFAYFVYHEDFQRFMTEAAEQLTRALNKTSYLDPEDDRDDLLHFSIIPWVSFTSFSHARRVRRSDSIPKIVFGKYFQDAGQVKMPVSVEVHHALMDGLHVGRFFDAFQAALAELLA